MGVIDNVETQINSIYVAELYLGTVKLSSSRYSILTMNMQQIGLNKFIFTIISWWSTNISVFATKYFKLQDSWNSQLWF